MRSETVLANRRIAFTDCDLTVSGAAFCEKSDPPPLKWSALKYGFRAWMEDHDAEEETQA